MPSTARESDLLGSSIDDFQRHYEITVVLLLELAGLVVCLGRLALHAQAILDGNGLFGEIVGATSDVQLDRLQIAEAFPIDLQKYILPAVSE